MGGRSEEREGASVRLCTCRKKYTIHKSQKRLENHCTHERYRMKACNSEPASQCIVHDEHVMLLYIHMLCIIPLTASIDFSMSAVVKGGREEDLL